MKIDTDEYDTINEARAEFDSHTRDSGGPGLNEPRRKRMDVRRWFRRVAYCSVLALPFLLAITAGYLKYLDRTETATNSARVESTRAASDAAVAMLTYHPDTVQNDLDAAKSRMTGSFQDSFSSLADDVVAPAAIQKLITAAATVPAAAPVSATQEHATVLLFVNQTVTIGKEAPSSANSTVRVTLDNIDGIWLVSGFEPI